MGYYNDKIISELRVRQLQLEAIYNKSCKYQHLSVEERYNSNMYNRLYNIYTYSKSKINTFKSWIALHQSIEGQNYYNTLEDYERVSLLARLTIVCLELSFEYCHSFATYRLADENKYLSDLRYNWIDFSDDFEEKRNQIKNDPLYIYKLIKEKRKLFNSLITKYPLAKPLWIDIPGNL